jgi:nuclear receptor interaction protein
MGKATRCVRRFAPNGKERTKSRYKGHITACKISNANPNEMIVSWSGDHIYSFDLIRAPDALDAPENQTSLRGKSGSRKRRTSKARKRKRQNATSLSSQSSGDGRRRSRRNEAAASQEEDGNLALRVRYGNGETENISFPELLHEAGSTASGAATSAELMERARYSVLNGAQRQSLRIAKGLVKLRKAMFSLEPAVREAGAAMPFRDAFSSVLMVASTFLPQMEQVMRTWGYPINPTPEVVRFQQTLRRHRESAYRFVQATGILARALGGDIQDFGIDDALEKFERIGPAPGEDNVIVEKEQFGYDFLKAIILFTEGGRSAVLSGFKGSSASRRNRDRFPLPQNALDGAIETILVPYLSDLAGDAPVVNVDSSRFEYDSTRILFPTQRAAVAAFGEALKVDMSSGSDGRHNDGPNGAANGNSNGTPNGTNPRATDPSTLTRFWLLEVGRGILMEVGTGVNFEYVNRAFGGLNATIEDSPDDDGDMEIERSQDDSEANIEEAAIHDISFTFNRDPSHQRHPAFMESWTPNLSTQTASEDGDYNGASVMNSGATDETDDTDDTEDDEGAEDDDDDDDDDSSDSDAAERLFRSYGFERSAREDEVEKDVPCSPHTRVYRGHCNVKTVKDCNFFGLNDEYVVSGSDSGHLFIWERDTCKLVNILKGDDEVVNVVQGKFSLLC